MQWVFLLIAGAFETGWAYFLKRSDGFSKWTPLIGYATCGLGAAFFLSLAMKRLPISIAYPMWVTVAVVGTTLLDAYLGKTGFSPLRAASLALVLAGVAGLKYSAPEVLQPAADSPPVAAPEPAESPKR